MDIVTELLKEHADDSKWLQDYDQMKYQMNIGLAVRGARHDCNMTQRELAQIAGVAHSTIARIENGDVEPSLDTLHKIADALGAKLNVSFEFSTAN